MVTCSFRSLLFLSLLIALTAYNALALDSKDFNEVRGIKKFAVTKDTGSIEISLDYKKAFEVDIVSVNGKETNRTFCTAYPETIVSELEFTASLDFFSDKPYSFDNVVYYKGFYFLLDSISYSILVLRDITDLRSSYFIIEADIHNTVDKDGEFEEPFMILGTSGILYVVTAQNLFTLDLENVLKAARLPDPVPNNSVQMKRMHTENEGYESILNVAHSFEMLFIVADKIVDIYSAPQEGILKYIGNFDAAFFGVQEVNIVDIVIRGNYAYVLDALAGVFVVDVSTYEKAGKFTHLPKLHKITVQKGKFIEIVGKAINIVVVERKGQFLEEYIIQGGREVTDIVFNRRLRLKQGVRDTYADGHNLYLLGGLFNQAVRTSVPARFSDKNVIDNLVGYWALLDATDLVSMMSSSSSSQMVAVNNNDISIITFSIEKPKLVCDLEDVKPGYYSLLVHSTATTCPEKENGNSREFDLVCNMEELVILYVADDHQSIGDVNRSNMNAIYLAAGLLGAFVLTITFICLSRKYRKKYRVLEDEIRFFKLDEQDNKEGAGNVEIEIAETNPENLYTDQEFVRSPTNLIRGNNAR